MKPPFVVFLGTILGFSTVWFAVDDRESHRQVDQAHLDHDALLVRIAVLQGQIDAREKSDREDEEQRMVFEAKEIFIRADTRDAGR
jgi:hypothetical protein